MSSSYGAGVDLLELAANNTQLLTESAVDDVRANASKIKQGRPGECFFCGEQRPRVVWTFSPCDYKEVEACAPCRDAEGLE